MIFVEIKLFDNRRLNIFSRDIMCCKADALKQGCIKNKKRVENL